MFVYTSHAESRIKERGLSKAQIEETALRPDEVSYGFGRRVLARRHFSGRTLEVIYSQQRRSTVIITAYWMED